MRDFTWHVLGLVYILDIRMKVRVDFKNRELEWCLTISTQFNGHADDKKAVRKAVMKELDTKYPSAKGFVQRIEVKHDR